MEYPGKQALLARVEAAWAEWEQLLARAGDRLTEPVEGTWSIRDVVNHMTAYERFLAQSLGGDVRPIPEMPQDIGFDVQKRNVWLHEVDLGLSVDEVMEEAPAVRAELLARLRERTDEQLLAPRHMEWHEWPLWRWVLDGPVEHYPDHAAHLRRWLERT